MTKTKIAIDFGSENIRIVDKNLGLVFNEPALVAVEKKGKKYVVLAECQEAYNMKNNLGENQLVFSPIEEGQMQSPEYAGAILKHALNGLFSPKTISSCECFISTPCGLSTEDKIKYIKACAISGLDKIHVIDSALCALLSSPNLEFENILIIDMGASKCDFQIYSGIDLQKSATFGLGSNSIRNAINKSFWHENSLFFSPSTLEKIQKELSSLFASDKRKFQAQAICTLNGEHLTKTISSQEIYPFIKGFFDEIAIIAKTLIKEYETNQQQNIETILITGGLTHTSGLEKFLTNSLQKPIILHNNPENAVILGMQKILN